MKNLSYMSSKFSLYMSSEIFPTESPGKYLQYVSDKKSLIYSMFGEIPPTMYMFGEIYPIYVW